MFELDSQSTRMGRAKWRDHTPQLLMLLTNWLRRHSFGKLSKRPPTLTPSCTALHYFALLCTIFTLALLLPAACLSADKNGVSPGSISLPKGPGSIEGLGESFQPNLNTGTAKYNIGLKLPPGTAGHAPSVSLNYEGGGANGPLGYGWSLPTAFIQRRSDHGIPTYGQDIGFPRQDSFINEMREELVPQTNGYFFCKNEGSFIRYQLSGDHWVGTLPSGTRLDFGLSANSRIDDGTNGHVFAWLLEKETDTHGNVIVYSYRSFSDETNLNQKYLATIRYGAGPPPWSNYHFVSFEYEDRPDWFEDCRSGFVVRTGKRLKTIRVGTQGVTLAGHLQGDFDQDGQSDYLDRAYQLEYLNYAGTNSHWSLISKVTPVAADGVSTLPPSTFGYAVSDPPESVSAAGHIIGGTNEPPVVMDNPLAELVDLNGDGLPDILKTDSNGGSHHAFLNLGEVQLENGKVIQWAGEMDVDPGSGTAWNYDLSSGDTHLADMDGDGLADLVHKTLLGDVIYFRNLGRVAWSEQQLMSVQDVAPPSPFGEVDVRTADLDFDKRMDVVQSVSSGAGHAYRIWFNLGNQTYSSGITVDQATGFDFSDQTVQLADINGDRIPDVAQVRPGGIVVTTGLGYGRFASAVTMSLPDYILDSTQVLRAKLTDLNGDGLADLVIERAAPGECWYWLNLGNFTFSTRKRITGLPTAIGLNAVVRWADINGNGSTDLVYADQQASPRIQAVDLAELLTGGLTPNILVSIDNGIGRLTTINYQPSTYFALADAALGQPWTNLMPLTVSVVAGVTNFDSLGHAYVSRFQYHDGYYDPVEKQFRGFGRVEQVEVGDASAPTLVTRSYFDTGAQYEVMKGKLLRLTTEQEDGKVFDDATTTWTIPPVVLMVGTNGTNVTFAHPLATRTAILELGQGTERDLESEMDYDQYGNQTRQADYGIVLNGDRSAFNDERVTTTEYAINTNLWLLRHPARQEVKDENGVVLSRVESFYDDESFTGNNFGVVTVGNLTLTRAWKDASDAGAYIKASRTRYDTYGNPVALLDPLAVAAGGAVDFSQGHVREVGYDPDFHTYATRETIHVGNGNEPLGFEASYDEGFGTVTSSADFNTNQTRYGYDVFGRLINVVRPYDSTAYPTIEYDYALAVPYGGGGLVNFVESRQLDKVPGSAATKRDHYLIGRQFTDGMGRRVMNKQEAEPVPGSSAPRVVVSGAVLFNARLKPSRTLNPYFTLQGGPSLDDLLAYESVEAPGWQGGFHQGGQLVSLDLASACQSSIGYDATLRMVWQTNGDGTFTRTVYEPLVLKSFDENDTDPGSDFFDTPLIQSRDGLGRVIRVDATTRLNDDGTTSGTLKTWATTYEYDLNDQFSKLTDPQGNVKTVNHDGLRRKTSMNDLDCGIVNYTYDDASNLKSTTDAKGQQISYTYDGANRLVTEDYLDENSTEFSYHLSPDVRYFYDQAPGSVETGDGTKALARNVRGNLAYVQDTSGEEHISYDARSRMEWVIKRVPDPVFQHAAVPSVQLVSFRSQFDYDSLDRVTRMVYPDNDQISYQYNERNLLQRINGGPGGSILSNLVYTPSAQQQQIDYGNGVRTSYGYDRRQRLNSLLTFHVARPTDPLISFLYDLDGASNIKAIQDQRVLSASDTRRNNQNFTYDDLYRLVRVQYNLPAASTNNGGQISYRYDRIGNMLAQTSDIGELEKGLPLTDLGSQSYGGSLGRFSRVGRQPGDPPGPHALSQISNPQSAVTNRVYQYDANGNMQQLDGLKCVWDFKDRLVSVEDETMRAEYTYDYSDNRVSKVVTYKPGTGSNSFSQTSRVITLYPGKTFEIRDHDQPTKYVFKGLSRVAAITGSLSMNTRIQRIRLWPGWNLLSLAVTATNLLGQLQQNQQGLVETLFQWNASTGDYSIINPGQTVPAGTALWVKATADTVVGLLGPYSEPEVRHLEIGGAYATGAGLEAWTPVVPTGVSTWSYDSEAHQWQEALAFSLGLGPEPPMTIAPGEAVYFQTGVPADLEIPDPALRVRYYHEDHLGSASVVTDASGNLVSEDAYYPFGHMRNEYAPRQIKEPYQFAQKERDTESGLSYFGKRFYSSTLGKWLSTDPMEEAGGGLNLYAYVNQNPLKYRDPDGANITVEDTKEYDKETKSTFTVHHITLKAVIQDVPAAHEGITFSSQELEDYKNKLIENIETSYTGRSNPQKEKWVTKVELRVLGATEKPDASEHVFLIVGTYGMPGALGLTKVERRGDDKFPGMVMRIQARALRNPRPDSRHPDKSYKSPESIGAHEFGHSAGLDDMETDKRNLMSHGRENDQKKILVEQLRIISTEAGKGHLNNHLRGD